MFNHRAGGRKIVVILIVLAGIAGCAWLLGTTAWSADLIAVQRQLHQKLAATMRAVKADHAFASWAAIGISLLYGVFHAVGPGHGKAVISTFLVSHESNLRRGLALTLAASILQAAVAIGLVEVVAGLLGLSFRQVQAIGTDVEGVSYALVAIVGLVLATRSAVRLWAETPASTVDVGRNRAGWHAHERGSACAECGPLRLFAAAPPPTDTRSELAVIVSAGIRPCSGALIVLSAAYALDLRWMGVLAVLAMAIGTAGTVGLLAVGSISIRHLMLTSIAALPGSPSAARVKDLAALVGGGIIAVLGFALLRTWSASPNPFF